MRSDCKNDPKCCVGPVSCAWFVLPNEPIVNFQTKLHYLDINYGKRKNLNHRWGRQCGSRGTGHGVDGRRRVPEDLEMAARLGVDVANIGNTITFRTPGYLPGDNIRHPRLEDHRRLHMRRRNPDGAVAQSKYFKYPKKELKQVIYRSK